MSRSSRELAGTKRRLFGTIDLTRYKLFSEASALVRFFRVVEFEKTLHA
jgi:hypothetical protein